jgi:hypothetical protein
MNLNKLSKRPNIRYFHCGQKLWDIQHLTSKRGGNHDTPSSPDFPLAAATLATPAPSQT